MENVNYTFDEITEVDEIYSMMNVRISNCKSLTAPNIYGPPDLCYLVKEHKPKSFLGLGNKKVNKIGAYHYLYGLDTSNIAFISTYISKITQKQQSMNKDIKITQSIFCCFDYFIQKDLRVLIKFPGGIKRVFYIDDQSAVEVNTEDLKTLLLSSFIRSFNLQSINNNSVYLEELYTPDTFNLFFEAVLYLVNENPEYKVPNYKEKLQVLLDCYIKYLMDSRRFNLAIINFSKLTTIDNSLVKYVIKPLDLLGLYEDALNYLASVLLYNPSASNLLSLEVNLLVSLGKLDDGLQIAKYISSLHPEKAENWICVGLVYLKKKEFEKCLRALNNIYFLKDYNVKEITSSNNNKELIFIENNFIKKGVINFKYNDILLKPKTVDVNFSTNAPSLCDNSDLITDSTNRIIKCMYYKFTSHQKTLYSYLLEIIKEVNFDAFIDLKRKLFYFNDVLAHETERSTFRSDGFQTVSIENKVTINPFLEVVFDNLIEDLKIFSIVIAQDEQYFNSLFTKESLSILETKFCIAVGILSERLLYYNTAIKFYSKALSFCFSYYSYYRKIKIYLKFKDFKSAVSLIAHLLAFIQPETLLYANKSPSWLNKIILNILSEISSEELLGYIKDSPKYICDFINQIIQKYYNWIKEGHDIHIIKNE